ncbi:hypothetical protein GCM10010359_42090 [Streptomyces morookaense]|nr:hypothetical protein GCM10010359_42090 [Streptomyces morookaense]
MRLIIHEADFSRTQHQPGTMPELKLPQAQFTAHTVTLPTTEVSSVKSGVSDREAGFAEATVD